MFSTSVGHRRGLGGGWDRRAKWAVRESPGVSPVIVYTPPQSFVQDISDNSSFVQLMCRSSNITCWTFLSNRHV